MFVFVGDFSYPQGGAPAARVRTIARGLVAGGESAAVVPLANAISGGAGDQSGDTGVRVLSRRASSKRPVVITGSLQSKARALTRMYLAIPYLIRELLSAGLCAPGQTLFLYGRSFSRLAPFVIIGKIKGMNVVLDVVEGLERFDGFGGRLAPFYWDCWLGTRVLPRLVDKVFTITQKLGERCREYGAQSVHSLPALECWPASPLSRRTRRDRFRLLYVGALFEKENPAMLLALVRNLATARDSLQIDIVGRYAENPTGRKWAERIQSDACAPGFVHFHGAVDEKRLDELKREADGFLLLRANTIAEELSFPTRLVEFLKLGKPVWASDVGEIGRVLRNGVEVYLLHPTDGHAAASVLQSSLMHEDALATVGLRGYEAGKRAFDRDMHIQRLIRLCHGEDGSGNNDAGRNGSTAAGKLNSTFYQTR